MDALMCKKKKKKSNKLFLCNKIAQIIKWNLLYLKKTVSEHKAELSSALNWGRKSVYIPWKLWVTILFSFDFELFSQTITPTPDISYDQNILLWVRAQLVNAAERLGFVISGSIKKRMNVINIKNKKKKNLQSETLLKMRLRHRSFVADFGNFFRL